MYTRSGFGYRGTSACALVLVLVPGNIRMYPRAGFLVPRNLRQNHPFCEPPKSYPLPDPFPKRNCFKIYCRLSVSDTSRDKDFALRRHGKGLSLRNSKIENQGTEPLAWDGRGKHLISKTRSCTKSSGSGGTSADRKALNSKMKRLAETSKNCRREFKGQQNRGNRTESL